MRRVPSRRLFAGIVGLLFAVSGLTRELAGTCPQHSGGYGSATGVPSVPTTLESAPAADEHSRHGAAHKLHASLPESAPHTGPAPAPGAPLDSHHGAHCDCIGDCCGCATVRLDGQPPIAIATVAPAATPALASTATERPTARVDIALPFANAPPMTAAA
jgi:hypothetical protein